MKGLLLKDFYLMARYCRSFLLIVVIFLALYAANPGNSISLTMMCVVTSIMPITLLSYDEREGWTTYSQTLPYTKAQYVSVKYVVGLALCLVSVVFLGLLAVLIPGGAAGFLPQVLCVVAAVCLLPPALMLPFAFRYGTEKARILYFILIGLVIIGMGFLAANFWGEVDQTAMLQFLSILPALFCGVSVVLYGASWLISIAWYQRREEP